MTRHSRPLSLLAAFLLVSGVSPGEELTEAMRRGRSIYREGMSTTGSSVEVGIVGGEHVPAFQLPCMQCHGPEGRGGVEAGITVPELRWERLSAPYGVPGPLNRHRPPYDSKSLRRAVHEGMDSGGYRLSPVMPRYFMSEGDLADLIEYLQILGKEPAPGVSDEWIRIGTLLPLEGPLTTSGTAVLRLLQTAFDDSNAKGGIHGRRLLLVPLDPGVESGSAITAAERLLDEGEGVLCFLANGGPGSGPELIDFLSERGVPLLGPLCFPRAAPRGGSAFHLMPSFEDQGRAAARFLRESTDGGAVAACADGSRDAERMRGAFVEEARHLGLEPSAWPLPPGESGGPATLVCFGGIEWISGSLPTEPHGLELVVSSLLSGGDWLRLLGEPAVRGVHAVAPPIGPGFWPGERSAVETGVSGPGELARLLRLADARAASEGGPASTPAPPSVAEMWAFSSYEFLEASLRAAGRELSRERLFEAAQGRKRLRTGFLPPITFGAVRRDGVRGALVFSAARGQEPRAMRWIDVRTSARPELYIRGLDQ